MTHVPTSPSPAVRRSCLVVLTLGILVRLIVFWHLAPQNNDNHMEVIRYIYKFGVPAPTSDLISQSYHPQLYHYFAASFMRLFHLGVTDLKAVQSLSLLFSLGTLFLIYGLIRHLPWLEERFKPWLLALPALHPQFLIYTLVISNDTLAIFIGTLLFDQAERCLRVPSLKRQACLALALGAGLLTKFTFLAFIPSVALLLAAVNLRQGLPGRVVARRLAALLLLAMAVGGYKFVENAHAYGTPFISNLDFDPAWAAGQRPIWTGPLTLLDINVLKLVRDPVISPATVHSWPLLIFGSFWYSYVPECGFLGNTTSWKWLGSAIDALALAPTLLMLLGALSALRLLAHGHRAATPSPCPPVSLSPCPPVSLRLFLGFALLALALNFLLLEQAAWKYDVWSVFQGRLLFPTYFAFLLLLHEGLRRAARWRGAWLGARVALTGLFLAFAVYLAVEVRLAQLNPVNPARHLFVTETVDMKAR